MTESMETAWDVAFRRASERLQRAPTEEEVEEELAQIMKQGECA